MAGNDMKLVRAILFPLAPALLALALTLALPSNAPAPAQETAAAPNTQATQASEETTILAFGDSLIAGYRLHPTQSFPARLEEALRERGIPARVINAGVTGDTTGDGLRRLEPTLDANGDIDAVILELGANDALRGLSPWLVRKHLAAMLDILRARDIPVLLTGMNAPPEMGREYAAAFNLTLTFLFRLLPEKGTEYVAAFAAVYPELAREYDVLFYPFFLEGVARRPEYNLRDGLHPNPAGIEIITANILPHVERLAAQAQTRPAP